VAIFTRRHERDDVVRDDAVDDTERWGSPPVVRGLFTLLGAAVAGFLIWLATQFDLGDTTEYWIAMAILAGAGLVMALSQLFGGWTKWGLPTLSPSVFLLGFLPTLIAVGGILLATRPTGQGTQGQVSGWIEDIGLGGLAEDLSLFQGVLAFGLGLVFGFIFDTTGPRTRRVVARNREVPDEDVHDYDTTATTGERAVVRDDRTMATAGDRVNVRDSERRDLR
jgi:hypothetical protein